MCAASLVTREVGGRPRVRCPDCRFVLYENPASASAGLVLDPAGRVLLVRRAIEPFQGAWAIPAGYQEADEDPSGTAVREVREETGITARVVRLIDLIHVPDDPRKPANVAVFLCRAEGGVPAPGTDAADAAWFALGELPGELGFDNGPRILMRLMAGGDLHDEVRTRP